MVHSLRYSFWTHCVNTISLSHYLNTAFLCDTESSLRWKANEDGVIKTFPQPTHTHPFSGCVATSSSKPKFLSPYNKNQSFREIYYSMRALFFSPYTTTHFTFAHLQFLTFLNFNGISSSPLLPNPFFCPTYMQSA